MKKPTKASLFDAFVDESAPDIYDPLTQPASSISLTSSTYPATNPVPNQFPSIPSSSRLAIIGEAPGKDEEQGGKPFIGMSGRILDQFLSQCNKLRATVFVGNVCQYRPPGNDISQFKPDGPEITEGLDKLSEDLKAFNPNVCLLLGRTALFAAKGTYAISDWRGSLFISDKPGPFYGRKCIAAYHPAYCLRDYSGLPLLGLDVRRAVQQALRPDLQLPQRELITSPTYDDTLAFLDELLRTKPEISCDIEGGVSNIPCLSISTDPSKSWIIAFTDLSGNSIHTVDQETQLWYRLSRVLADPGIKKVWQNGLYDRFVLQYGYNVIVKGNKEDTLLQFWEAYCEFEKSLGFQCSILTEEPFYKFQRKTQDLETYYRYCCKDSAVTLENNRKLHAILSEDQRKHYYFNNALLNFLLYSELRGIRYDQTLADSRRVEMVNHVAAYQDELDEIADSYGVIKRLDFSKTNPEILSQVNSICCYKRDQTKPKAEFLEKGYYEISAVLLSNKTISAEERGRIGILTKTTLNLKSPKFKEFLYETLKLPIQYSPDPETKQPKPTSNFEALLRLSQLSNHRAVGIALDLSRLRTRAQMLALRSVNGRMHCSYNLVGSETGRVTSSKSMIYVKRDEFTKAKRVGGNMQTVPDDWDMEDEDHPLTQGMRDLFVADPGCYLAKCDLKGADGWTVGAYMAMLGDPTMLDDLKFGLKPAQIVAYILKHGAEQIQNYANDRPKLKELVSEIKKDDWEYFVSKQGIWGTCYTMGPRKLAERVFIESEGKVNLSEKQAREFQSAIYVRYRVKLWHDWMQRFLGSQVYPAKLVAENGFTRKFYGRKNEILGQALAHMPQVVTTHATLLAAYKLWTDPENRVSIEQKTERVSNVGSESRSTLHRHSLRIEPMHQVHDELLVQFKISDTSWAVDKIKSWFNNPMKIANQILTIPYDGAYGTNWAMDENGKVGTL